MTNIFWKKYQLKNIQIPQYLNIFCFEFDKFNKPVDIDSQAISRKSAN